MVVSTYAYNNRDREKLEKHFKIGTLACTPYSVWPNYVVLGGSRGDGEGQSKLVHEQYEHFNQAHQTLKFGETLKNGYRRILLPLVARHWSVGGFPAGGRARNFAGP